MEKQLRDFSNFEEITDAHNDMVEELEKLRTYVNEVQLDLKGAKV